MPSTPAPARDPPRGWPFRRDRALPCHRGPGVVRHHHRLVRGTRREPRGVGPVAPRMPTAFAEEVRAGGLGPVADPGCGPEGSRRVRQARGCLLRRRSVPAHGRVGAAHPPAPDFTVGSMTAQPIRDGALGDVPASCATQPHSAGAASCRVRRFRRRARTRHARTRHPAPGTRRPGTDGRRPGADGGPCGRRRVPPADAGVPRPLQETGERTGRAVAASRARKPEHPAPVGRAPCDDAPAGRVTSPPPPARTSSATPPR